MKLARCLGLLLVAAVACNREAPSRQQAAKPAATKEPSGPDDTIERQNLLNFAHGAAVVSRTGEFSLAASAVAAIDGDITSGWTVNNGDYPQTMTIALATRSRIERVGVATTARYNASITTIDLESSIDGVTYTPLAHLDVKHEDGPQLTNVKPVDAVFIRATLVSGGAGGRVASLFAFGREVAPPSPRSLAGCWTINGVPATLSQNGAHVFGTIETTPPTHIDGGFDGRLFRFMWTRGAAFGPAAISISPDSHQLSGHQWHEEAVPLFFAESWFGDRNECTATIAYRGEVTQALFRRSGRAPLFGLAFDANGNIIERESVDTLAALRTLLMRNPSLQARLVAHEFHAATPEKNRALANAKLASIEQSLMRNGMPKGRLGLIAAGSDEPREIPVTDAMRALYGSVDLEVRR